MERSNVGPHVLFSERSQLDLRTHAKPCISFAMARKVFFIFHYQPDLWRVNVVRNNGVVQGIAGPGFLASALLEQAVEKGENSVNKITDTGLYGTTVTH